MKQVIRCRAGAGGQGRPSGDGKSAGPDRPLEKWVREMGGLISRHQTTGRVRVFAAANTWRTQKPRGASGFGAAAAQHSKEVRPKSCQGIIRCRPKNSEAVAMRSGAHEGLMCPLEKGVRGIETSGSGYLRQQIRGGRKGRAECQGLGQSPNTKRESSDERLKTLPKNGSFLLSHLVWQYHRR